MINTLSKQMVESALKAWGRKYLIDSDGDYRVDFDTDSPLGDLHTYYRAAAGDMFDCFGLFELKIPQDHLSRALFLCNEYNEKKMLPKVYLQIDETSGGKVGRLWCQQVHDLEKGIHVEGLTNFMKSFVGGCYGVIKWLTEERQFDGF